MGAAFCGPLFYCRRILSGLGCGRILLSKNRCGYGVEFEVRLQRFGWVGIALQFQEVGILCDNYFDSGREPG
jgi:hypothetical protein